jgi:hypothetical protein
MTGSLFDDDLLADAIAASGPRLQTVEIVHVPDHSYLRGPRGARGCKRLTSAGVPCNRARSDVLHNVPTLNDFGSGNTWVGYQGALKKWKPWLQDALAEAGLPRPLDSVLVEGMMCFPTRDPTGARRGRDQGNHRYFIEKALGDALEDGGWLVSDSWAHYEFGNLAHCVIAGQRWTSLRLFPNALGDAS